MVGLALADFPRHCAAKRTGPRPVRYWCCAVLVTGCGHENTPAGHHFIPGARVCILAAAINSTLAAVLIV